MVVVGVAALAATAGFAGEPPPRSIVIIGQEDPILPWNIAVNTVARTTLNADSDRRVVIYAEDLDFGRFGGDRYKRQLQNHLREKYMYVPVGALLAFGPIAFDFVMNARESIWPGVPVVFGAVDEAVVAKAKLPAGFTGRTLRFRLEDMVQSANAVVPDLKQVALVGDPFDRSTFFRNFAMEIPELAKNLQFIDLTGLPLKEVRRRAAQLPEQTAMPIRRSTAMATASITCRVRRFDPSPTLPIGRSWSRLRLTSVMERSAGSSPRPCRLPKTLHASHCASSTARRRLISRSPAATT
jgi:hypothetical protein